MLAASLTLSGLTVTSCTGIEDNPTVPEPTPDPEPDPEPVAKEKFELGKPDDDNYRYLDDFKALKEYINYAKYPNFKLGAGTTVNDYLNNSLVRNLTNKNFSETVAGNAMKMASCVDGNGNMNFTTVKRYVDAATDAGLGVYGHTLAWHSQQPKGWLLKLLADKQDPNGGEEVWTTIASKDFRKDKSVGWKSDETTYGYSLKFDNTNGLDIHTTKKNTNSWDVQFLQRQAIFTASWATGPAANIPTSPSPQNGRKWRSAIRLPWITVSSCSSVVTSWATSMSRTSSSKVM